MILLILLWSVAVSGQTMAQFIFHGERLDLSPHQFQSGIMSGLMLQSGVDTMPFWLTANRMGLFDTRSAGNALFYQTWRGHFLKTEPNWEMTIQGNYSALLSDEDHAFRVSTLSVHLTGHRFFRFSAGRYPEIVGFTAPYLSTGAMMQSLNALPLWKVAIENPEFWSFPGSWGRIQFKGRWSEGITTDNRYMDGTNVHQKYLYINVKPHRNLNLMGGFIHQVQWGGSSPDGRREHRSFSDYLSSVFGSSESDAVVTPLGNSIAAYDFAATFHHSKFSAAAMRLFYLEDLVSTRFRSPWDGLWSGWFHWKDGTPAVNYVVYEHINTKQQDARIVDIPGRANYYTHGRYRNGWTHYGHGMGNPLFTVDPARMGTPDRTIVNGIMIGHHLGLTGYLNPNLKWSGMFTWTRNYGVCTDQMVVVQSCYSSQNVPLREQDNYIPLSELRKDRFSMYAGIVYRISKKASSNKGAKEEYISYGSQYDSEGVNHSGKRVFRPGNEENIRSEKGTKVSGKYNGSTPDRVGVKEFKFIEHVPSYLESFFRSGYDVDMKLSIAFDWGEFYDQPRIGLEFGLILFLK